MRRSTSVYEKGLPARSIMVEFGLTDEEAVGLMRALIQGGYGVVPRNPTNGMLASYLEALTPPKGHEAVITAIGKARARWQAMFQHGVEMALSRKFMAASAIEARSDETRSSSAEGESAPGRPMTTVQTPSLNKEQGS